MRRLNNLVTELYTADGLSKNQTVEVENPREGWVYLACDDTETLNADGARLVVEGTTLSIEGAALSMHQWDGKKEAMCYLPEGVFTVSTADAASNVVVRAVPEMAYCKYGYNPFIPEYGPYDWNYLSQHVLPHVNTIIGGGGEVERPQATEWKQRGGHWIVERSLPTVLNEAHHADDVVEKWTDTPGFNDPLYDGILLDEFFCGDRPSYPAFTEAVRRIGDDERYKGRTVYPYVGSHFPDRDDWGAYDPDDTSSSSVPFLRAVFEAGYRIAWERYMQERHEEAIGQAYIDERMINYMRQWLRVFPNAAKHMVVVFGYMDIGFALDIHPLVDMKVYRDMQFHALATAEPFDGLYGVTGWTSGYADDETIRWTARLYRHYGIEGNTEPLSDQYGYTYRNDHIWNPEFEHHWEGWDFPVNNEKTCAVKSHPGYSILQGRWQHTTCGDTFLVMTRSADRPNDFSQRLRNLKPGKLYSVNIITSDYGDLLSGTSAEKLLGLDIRIDGVDLVPEKSFVSVKSQHPTVELDSFDKDNQFYMNYHRCLVRATSDEARLSISDWKDGAPMGEIGQEIAINFVQVQEYFED
jgi:hypothetical protein